MIFSIQRLVEEYITRRGLADVDQYAVKVANLYDRMAAQPDTDSLAKALSTVRTTFFRRNAAVDRKRFEQALSVRLAQSLKKKTPDAELLEGFRKGLSPWRRATSKRLSMLVLLAGFKDAVESRAADAFWVSRRRGATRAKAEKLAQALLAVYTKAILNSGGIVLREVASGIGFVDIGVVFSRVLHLVEIKILNGKLHGMGQLSRYMRTEHRRTGWLVLIDFRTLAKQLPIPKSIPSDSGLIRTVVVCVNPPPPHDL